MSIYVTLTDALAEHVGHDIVLVSYGIDEPVNISVECEDCHVVLRDADLVEWEY